MDLWHLSNNMKVMLTLQTLNTELNFVFIFHVLILLCEIKRRCAFTKDTTQKSITKWQSTSLSWYYLQLGHLILNATNWMRKISGNAFLRHLGGRVFHIPKVVLNHEVEGVASPPPSVANFEHVSRFILLLILLKFNK